MPVIPEHEGFILIRRVKQLTHSANKLSVLWECSQRLGDLPAAHPF